MRRPIRLSFHLAGQSGISVKPVVSVSFRCEVDAKLFRRGFRHAYGDDMMQIETDSTWYDRGAAFATPFRFLVWFWNLNQSPPSIFLNRE